MMWEIQRQKGTWKTRPASGTGSSGSFPNLWISGERSPQDPSEGEMTWGQADMLRRVIPGTYIMEETGVPPGYTRAFPQAVRVEETRDIQRTAMTDEKIRVEILKTDGTETYRIPVVNGESGRQRNGLWRERAFIPIRW